MKTISGISASWSRRTGKWTARSIAWRSIFRDRRIDPDGRAHRRHRSDGDGNDSRGPASHRRHRDGDTWPITPGDVNSVALTITKGDGGNNPVVRMVHPNNQTTTGQRPFNARRDGESDYFEVNGRLGGTNAQPGIAIGPGGAPRDVTLFRGGADLWETPDTMNVGALQIAGADVGGWVSAANAIAARTSLGLGTLATANNAAISQGGTGASNAGAARTNLGLGSAAVEDVGTSSGDIAVLGTGGRFAHGPPRKWHRE